MADIPQWWMKGDWFDVCSCDIPCPCEFAQPPTNNHCDGLMAYHIRDGAYGDVRLDGFSVIAVLWIDGNFWTKAKVTFGVFIDERADEHQREALQKIFSGHAGGFMAKITGLMGDGGRWIEFVPISFEVADDLLAGRDSRQGASLGRGFNWSHDTSWGSCPTPEPTGVRSRTWAGLHLGQEHSRRGRCPGVSMELDRPVQQAYAV